MLLGSYVVVAVTLIFVVSLSISYTLAVTSHHVQPFLPYVSYIGNRPWESQVFSLANNISAAFIMLIVNLRNVQLSDVIEKSNEDEWYLRKMTKFNKNSMVFGHVGAVGLSIVSSFQQKNFASFHFLGVFLCTYISFAYFILQTMLTYKLVPHLTNRPVKIIRLIVVIMSGIVLVSSICVGVNHVVRNPSKPEFISSDQQENDVVIENSVLEWSLLILYLIYIGSFYPDMSRISLKCDEIVIL